LRVDPRLLALALCVCAVSANAQDSYILGEDKDTGPDLGPQHATFDKLRDHRYSERFAVERVNVASDGSEVVAITRASREGAQAWDLKSGRSMKLPPMSRDAATIAWSPSKDLLAVTVMSDVLSGQQAGIELLRMSDGGSAGFLIGGERATTLSFSPDGAHLAAATGSGVLIFALPGGKSWQATDSSADTVTWLSPSQLMVASDGGARIERIDMDGKRLESWEGKRTEGGICFSPTGRFVALGQEGEFRVIDLWNGGAAQRVLVQGAVNSLAWSMNGKVLVAGVDVGLVHVFGVQGVPGIAFSSEAAASGRGGRTARAEGRDDERDRARDDGGDRSDRGRDDRSDRSDRGRDDGMITLRGDDRSRDDRVGAMEAGGPSENAADIEASLRVLVLQSMGSEMRDGAKMEASLTRSLKRIEPCWKRQIRAGKLGRGKLVMEMGVNVNGEGVSIQPPVEDTLANEKMLSCLTERMREPLFGSGLGSMDIELTIELQ